MTSHVTHLILFGIPSISMEWLQLDTDRLYQVIDYGSQTTPNRGMFMVTCPILFFWAAIISVKLLNL